MSKGTTGPTSKRVEPAMFVQNHTMPVTGADTNSTKSLQRINDLRIALVARIVERQIQRLQALHQRIHTFNVHLGHRCSTIRHGHNSIHGSCQHGRWVRRGPLHVPLVALGDHHPDVVLVGKVRVGPSEHAKPAQTPAEDLSLLRRDQCVPTTAAHVADALVLEPPQRHLLGKEVGTPVAQSQLSAESLPPGVHVPVDRDRPAVELPGGDADAFFIL
mmetsp:Transcript_50323/g.107165  ORF Transcript_50323/g.107165 Transcript_50323/m.107165 type:complete len:217 (-) Transcript_50323:1060-1710(-)